LTTNLGNIRRGNWLGNVSQKVINKSGQKKKLGCKEGEKEDD